MLLKVGSNVSLVVSSGAQRNCKASRAVILFSFYMSELMSCHTSIACHSLQVWMVVEMEVAIVLCEVRMLLTVTAIFFNSGGRNC